MALPIGEASNDEWIRGNNFPRSAIVFIDFKEANIKRIPFLAVIDKRGTIRSSWAGKLTEKQQQEVIFQFTP